MQTSVQPVVRPTTHAPGGAPLGWWIAAGRGVGDFGSVGSAGTDLDAALRDLTHPLFVIEGESGTLEARSDGEAHRDITVKITNQLLNLSAKR